MFDSIRFEDISILPKPEGFDLDLSSLDFQTKSVDNALYLFTIGKDKYLYREDGPFRENTEEPSRRYRIDFHGIIKFGAYHSTDLIDYSVEYEAKFTDGVLQDIKLLQEYKTYHESKKERWEKLKEINRRQNKRLFNRIISAVIVCVARLFGIKFESNFIGIFRSENITLCFYAPKIILGYKKQIKTTYGLSISETTTEICLSKLPSMTEFSFKILGFGFVIVKSKDSLWD